MCLKAKQYHFGNRVTAWMAKMLRKAATGAWHSTGR
jgi:hypothetical protein